ncbi:hypothetical protein [Zhihengliuella salsuginis]|uniref:2'-5' RNA ligase superfamily protein n=1 Tax=Zhihengliuella salsuginis TaxID=578222 RepID=A0ABQ3GFY6_9MICC|nr:hypothetical protein [Zhihengliuella salsuginis]GHD02778.1 hypothetical protein GCM10008096_08290 [Zhihengliuella salsuginis]
MGSYVVVVFVHPLAAGTRFGRREWPLHATLLRFDAAGPPALIRRLAGGAVARVRRGTALVGADDRFGRGGSVPVSLLAEAETLSALHRELHAALTGDPEAGTRLPGPRHALGGYRPHISHTTGRPHPGERLEVAEAALVDMRPDGDSRYRKVLAVWPLDDGGRSPHGERPPSSSGTG